jgi:hypothetical protein
VDDGRENKRRQRERDGAAELRAHRYGLSLGVRRTEQYAMDDPIMAAKGSKWGSCRNPH